MISDSNYKYRWYADVIVYRTFGLLITCLGIIGATLSLFVFRRKSLRKKSCSIYFSYMALADLLCMICWLVHFVLPTYNIHIVTISNGFCKIFVFAIYFSFDFANYILTVCSIDRTVIVSFPSRSRIFCRRRIAHIITFILVIIFTLLNSHLLYGFVVLSAKTNFTTTIQICHHRNDLEKYQKIFSIYDSYVDVIKTNIIPFIIMSICNVMIITRVCRSTVSIKTNGKTREKSKKKIEKDRQLTFMLLGSSFSFLLLTIPTEINDIIRSHANEKVITEKNYLLSAILLTLANLNYAVHFYIYTLTGGIFRQQLLILWPIRILLPRVLTRVQCRQPVLETSCEQTISQTRDFDAISSRNNQIDISTITMKLHGDDETSFVL